MRISDWSPDVCSSDLASGRGRAKGAGEGALPSAGNTPSQASDAPAFPAHHIHLTRSYRQSASLNLAPLATAVRQGATTTALSLPRTGHPSGVHLPENNADPLSPTTAHLPPPRPPPAQPTNPPHPPPP